MAKCEVCEQEMTRAQTCIEGEIFFVDRMGDVATMRTIPYTGTKRCPDCNVRRGAYHHTGCSKSQCPRCGGQEISCDCELATEEQVVAHLRAQRQGVPA